MCIGIQNKAMDWKGGGGGCVKASCGSAGRTKPRRQALHMSTFDF